MKKLAIPVTILVGVIILMLISGKIAIENIFRLHNEISNSQTIENMLQQKLNSLTSVSPTISEQSSVLLQAVPSSNSSLDAISLIQNQTLLSGLLLNNLNSQSSIVEPSTAINSTEIDFSASGSYSNILQFITKIRTSLPITRFDSLKIKGSNISNTDTYNLTATIFSYWATLPNTLPSIDQPIVALTPDEQKLVSQITSFSENTVNISNGTSPESLTKGRTNPFQ
ncbi:hypothetical protein BH10PAT1_BH10PAT1_4260 [soil metagenome]